MIVDFTLIKNKLEKGLNLYLRNKMKGLSIVSQLAGKHIIKEGNNNSYETVDHEKRAIDLKKVQSGFNITPEEMRTLRIPDLLAKVDNMAKDMAEQMERSMLSTLITEVENAENMLSGNPELSMKSILQALEAIELDFDDTRDKPHTPSIIASPEACKKMFEEEKNMTTEEKQEFEKKRNEILDKKYAEYLKRKSERKIID